jgi:hypothetical protein
MLPHKTMEASLAPSDWCEPDNQLSGNPNQVLLLSFLYELFAPMCLRVCVSDGTIQFLPQKVDVGSMYKTVSKVGK